MKKICRNGVTCVALSCLHIAILCTYSFRGFWHCHLHNPLCFQKIYLQYFNSPLLIRAPQSLPPVPYKHSLTWVELIGDVGQRTGVHRLTCDFGRGCVRDTPSGGVATPQNRLHPCPAPVLITPQRRYGDLVKRKEKGNDRGTEPKEGCPAAMLNC